MWYTGKFDEATWNLFASCGATARYLREKNRGLAAVQQNTTYKKELVAGDVITIWSSILAIREKVVQFRHEMYNDQLEMVAFSELTGVHLDSVTRKACSFPTDITERLRQLILNP